MSSWRFFGSDSFPFFSWVIFRFQPLIFQGVWKHGPRGYHSSSEDGLKIQNRYHSSRSKWIPNQRIHPTSKFKKQIGTHFGCEISPAFWGQEFLQPWLQCFVFGSLKPPKIFPSKNPALSSKFFGFSDKMGVSPIVVAFQIQPFSLRFPCIFPSKKQEVHRAPKKLARAVKWRRRLDFEFECRALGPE